MATQFLEETVSYPTGNLAGQGSWIGGSGSQVALGSLSYPGLQSPAIASNKIMLPNTASTALKPFAASPIASGSLYLSLILKQTTLSASISGATLAGLDDDGTVTTSNGRVAGALGIHLKQASANTYAIGIRKGTGTTGAGGGTDAFITDNSFGVGEVVFLVAKYTFGPDAGDDTVTLWVNPPTNSFSGSEPTPSINATTTGNPSDATQLRYIFVRCNSSTGSGVNEVDDIRVGSTWADVTPNSTNTPPGPGETRPYITQALLTPQIVLRGTNGPPNQVYRVLAATDIALPAAQWSEVTTNLFDANGNFDSTNPAPPAEPQRFFRLLVGGFLSPPGTAPAITNQTGNLLVVSGNTASISVEAGGSAPLSFQWYFNTNTLLTGETNATLNLVSVTTNNAGQYFVIVTNAYGSATSAPVVLTVSAPGSVPDFSMVGFATLNGFASNGTFIAGGTTGGGAGPIVVASNLTWLVNFAERSNMPLRILIVSNIDCSPLANHHGGFPAGYPTGEILISSNKTIYSTNGVTISRGSFRIGKAANGKDNIIIRNLKFRDLWVYDPSGNYDTYGWDYIGLEGGSHHVWVDHCDFEQVYDGMVDIVHASDYVTVSWNVFRAQKKCSLVGHSDNNASEDTGHLNMTFHHNYYVDVDERMPRMRFGNAHVFNLYCENLGGNGIQSTANAATLVENSYFFHPQPGTLPTREENGGPTGIIKVVNSRIENLPGVNVQFRQLGETNFSFNAPFANSLPPYPYAMDDANAVPGVVTNWAGVGKLSF